MVSYILGIADHRDDLDSTAGFDIAHDRQTAALLERAYPSAKTFHGLLWLYETYMEYETVLPSEEEVDRLCAAGLPDSPLTATELANGTAILDKIDLYAEEAGVPFARRGQALENGSSVGYFLPGFAKYFDHVVAVDFSLSFLVLAKKMIEEVGATNVELVCCNVERLPFAADRFQFVHSNNVIEHVTQKQAMIEEAKRVLAPHGLFFVMSPNLYTLYREPHYRLPFYGFIPKPLRRLHARVRLQRNDDDVSLISLGALKGMLREQFAGHSYFSFIPRQMAVTASGGKLRGAVVSVLTGRVTGRVANALLNRVLLPVMPYHVAISWKP